MSYCLWLFLCLTMVLTCTTNPVSPIDTVEEFWSCNPELEEYAQEKMEKAKFKLHTIQDVKSLQARFKYIIEIENFEPTIEIIFARDLIGNCKSAALLGNWSLKQIGIESRFVDLQGNDVKPHRICISDDNTIMITGNEVWWNLNPELWQNEVLSLFKYVPYIRMNEVK